MKTSKRRNDSIDLEVMQGKIIQNKQKKFRVSATDFIKMTRGSY